MNTFYDTLYPALPVVAQNWACTVGGWWRFRSRFSRHFHETVARWEETAGWPEERLLELQRERLDALIRRARQHVPYYRDLPEPSRAKDPALAIRETLRNIPPLDKLAYRDQPEAFIARDIPSHRLISGRTSGTTGTALPLWCTPETLAEEYASVWRMRRSVGVDGPATPNLTFNGNIVVPFGQARPPFYRISAYDHRALFSVYHMTPTNLRSYVDAVHSLPARYIEGYPSAIHLVARALLEQDRPFEPGRIDAIFTSSESLLAFQRETIEKAFAAPVRDRYGVSEKVVSMTECEQGRLHVDMEFCIVEVETATREDGVETGSLIVTGLAQHATPMFRYRIGDVGTRPRHPCSCGRAGDVFLWVDGRIEDYVMTPDGRLIGRLDHIFKDQHDVAEAQILQDTKEAVEIRIVPRESWSEGSERTLRKEVRARLGDQIGVTIDLVKDIPREPNGKLRAVKSRVGHLAA